MTLHPPIAPNSPPGAPPALATGPRVGVLLRRGREERHQSIADVAAALRIREDYLKAIEAGAYERLPGQTYTVGFVRSYANYLGLDAEEAVRVFKRERQGFDPAPATLAMPAPLPQRSVPGGRVLVIGLVLAICGYGLWSYLGGSQGGSTVAPVPTASSGEPNPREARAAVGDQASPPPAAPASSASPQTDATATPPSAPTVAAPTPTARPAPVASAAEPSSPAAAAAPQQLALAGTGAVPAPSAPATQPPSPPSGKVFGVTGGPSRIELRFTSDCWVQVRGPGSDLSSGKLMHAGDVYRVPDHPDLTIRVGNTAAMNIAVDGKPVTLPKGRSLVQTIALDPTRLAAGTAEMASHHGSGTELASQRTGTDEDAEDAAPRRSARADRAAAAAATADAARNAPTFINDLPPPRPRPVPVALPPKGPPLGALNTPPPPPDQPPPPDEND